MKYKLIICTLVAAFAISKTTVAQSSVGANNAAASSKVNAEGIKFPMTASEYNAAKQKLAQQKQNPPAPKQEVAPGLKVIAISNEDLKKLEADKQAPGTSAAPASKPVTTTVRSN